MPKLMKSKKANKLRALNAFDLIVLKGKMEHKTDQQIADELGVCRNTILRSKDRLKEAEWYKEMENELKEMGWLALEGLRANLLKADPFVTVNYIKGLGLFKEHQVLESKLSPEEFRKKVLEDKDRLLGSRIGNRIKDFINPEST